jgi:signal transduction histidine kinase
MGTSSNGWARVAGTSVRARVLRAIIAMALAPLVLLGALTLFNLQRLSARSDARLTHSREVLRQQVVEEHLASEAENVANDVSRFVAERVKDVQLWSSDPVVVRKAGDAAAEAVRLGLPSRSPADLEGRYAASRPLAGDSDAADYLQDQQHSSPAFAEIFFTDSHGYTVASTARNTDFVQSDEPWWTATMDKGFDVGPVAFDESNNTFSTDIAVRIENSSRQPVGVMRALLSMARIQAIVNRYADEGAVSVVDERGRLIAETASRHDPSRILNDSIDVVGALPIPLAEAFRGARRSARAAVADDLAMGAAGTRTVTESGDVVPFDWVVTVTQPTSYAFRPLQSVDELGTDISRSTRWVAGVVLLLLVIVALAAVFVGRTLADRITQPILALRDAARRTASIDLPELVAAIDRAQPGDRLPHIAPVAVGPGDEVESLAESYNALITTASDLAAEQVDSRRRNVATAFISMGRRNQKLVSRQLQGFDDLERSETDPDRLASIFQLDHLATRMRRNAESLLVLAGEEPVRRWTAPVHLRDVVRAAVTEIEDLERVEIDTIHDGAVKGQYVADLAHLLAELLENATMFSPPDVSVTVQGRVRDDRYEISVIDQGMGMTADEIYDANQRLSHPEEFDRAPSQMLGLFVVGRLAARHGIAARLYETSTGGMTARVTLPAELLELPEAPADVVAPPTTTAEPAPVVPPMTARPYTMADPARKWGPDDAFRPPREDGAGTGDREAAASATPSPAHRSDPAVVAERTPPAPVARPVPHLEAGPVSRAGVPAPLIDAEPGPAPPVEDTPSEVTPSGFRRRASKAPTGSPAAPAGRSAATPPTPETSDAGYASLPAASETPDGGVAVPLVVGPPDGGAVPEPAVPIASAPAVTGGPGSGAPDGGQDADNDDEDDGDRVDVTMSGFRRRARVEPGAAGDGSPPVAVPPRPASADRSAADVQATLSSFVSGVDRGRREVAGMPEETGADAGAPAPATAGADDEIDLRGGSEPAAAAADPDDGSGGTTPTGLRRRARTTPAEAAAVPAPASPPRSAAEVRSTLTAFVGGVDRGRRDATRESGDARPAAAAGEERSAEEVRSTLTAFVAGVDRGRREAAGDGPFEGPDASGPDPARPPATVENHPDDALAVTGASSGNPSSEEGEG